MVGVGFRISGMGSYAKRGDAPLAVTVLNGNNQNSGVLILDGNDPGYQGTDINELDPASAHTLDTQGGDASNSALLVIFATATGGTGSYAYSWAIAEQEDQSGIGGAGCAVLASGTTNKDEYSDFTFRITQPALVAGGPPPAPIDPPPTFDTASYLITCTVTGTVDGVSQTVQDAYTLTIRR